MVVTKMSYTKITCIECDCWSLPYDIRKTIRGYKIYSKQIKSNVDTSIYTKRIGDKKTNQKKRNSRTLSKGRKQEINPHHITLKSADLDSK